MASTFGNFFAVWWTLLVTASSEAHVGTFFNLVLRLELVMGIPLVHQRDVFHQNINWSYGDWMLLSKFPFRHVLIFLCITFFRRRSLFMYWLCLLRRLWHLIMHLLGMSWRRLWLIRYMLARRRGRMWHLRNVVVTRR